METESQVREPLSIWRDMAISLYLYIVVISVILSGALESPYLLLSYPTVALASPMTTILISTLFQTYIFIYLPIPTALIKWKTRV